MLYLEMNNEPLYLYLLTKTPCCGRHLTHYRQFQREKSLKKKLLNGGIIKIEIFDFKNVVSAQNKMNVRNY